LARATLRSILGDDPQSVAAGSAQRPAAADHRRLPATTGRFTLGGRIRWSRSSLVAASSGVVLIVLVAAFAAVRGNGPSSAASSAASSPVTGGGTASSAAGPPAAGASSGRPAKSSAPAAAPVGHKGVGIKAGTGVGADLAASGASWYYNWSATPDGISTPASVAFVPMIKTPRDVNAATLSEVKHEGKFLLGFNEPDVANEANLTVSQALNLWPRLEATGMELGSPAVSFGTNKTSGWLGQFMQGARDRGYRVDFITVHWYGQHHWTDPATNVNGLKSYLQQTYELYHKPIWITEFSLIAFSSGPPSYATPAQEAAFLTAATKMLAGLPYVQRYAWYTLTGTHNGGNTVLFGDGKTTPTAVGKAFKEVP